MARSNYRRHYRSRDEISYEYARQHIDDYHRLVRELGGTVEDVKQYLFSLAPQQLQRILDAYEQKHGAQKRKYAASTVEKWRTSQVHMSGTVAERLFALLPPYMPLATQYQLIENLWNHVGPKSKKTLRIGLDASIEQALDAITSHINDVVVHFRIPESLECRLNWLAAGDAHVKQDLLNHLRSFEKALVVDGARAHLPVMLEHLRSESGRQTHRIADVLKIGNHELELLIDKAASGVCRLPFVPLQSAVSRATSAATGNYKWLWLVAAAAIALFIYARYQPDHAPALSAGTPTPQSPVVQRPTPSETTADHRPGRVNCDVQWSNLHRPPAGIGTSFRIA